MRNRRALALLLIFFFQAASGENITQAQEKVPDYFWCPKTAEQILSHIKTYVNLSPDPEKILIVGEVRMQRLLIFPEKPPTLMQALAMSGGLLKTSNLYVYLIRRLPEEEMIVDWEFSVKDIRHGIVRDVPLKKGDVIYAPGICINGRRHSAPRERLLVVPPGPVDSPMPKKTKSRKT
jgi:hypothetical protein